MVFALPDEDDNEPDVDSLSSTSEGESRDSPNPPVNDADKETRNKIISQEETNVRNARFFVIIAGIACAVAVAAAINTFASDSEQTRFEVEVRNFEQRRSRNLACSLNCVTENTSLTQFVIVLTIQYDDFAAGIVSQAQLEVQFNFALMQQTSASVTSSALMTGAIFPNLTQSYFEIAGGYVDGMGGMMSVAFAPLVKAEKQSEWVEYSIANQG
jgi:hypothetical protein